PTSSSASSTLGETTSGSARIACRNGSPSVSITVVTSARLSSRIRDAYTSGSTPRGSEPANTTIAAPRARYRSLSWNSSIALLDGAMPAAQAKVGHREGLVDGSVERDRDDHAGPLTLSTRCAAGDPAGAG